MSSPGPVALRHLQAGWLGLLVFLTLGIVLETLHGLKVPFYLDLSYTTRRMLWTLAHAHGTLFSLVQIATALSAERLSEGAWRMRRGIWWSLLTGQVALPSGFLMGGLWLTGGDAGPGIFLVPVGAVAFFGGVAAVTWNIYRATDGPAGSSPQAPSPPTDPLPETPLPDAVSSKRRKSRR